MKRLLTPEDFLDEIEIPATERPEVYNKLKRFIEQYEPAFLDAALGVDFAQVFYTGAGADTPDAQWVLLVNGGAWTDGCGNATVARRIQGLKWCAARYVYFFWARNGISISTPSGEKSQSTDNSTSVSPAWKQTQAWNSLNRELSQLWLFLRRHQVNGSLAFPDFLNSRPQYAAFRITSPIF